MRKLRGTGFRHTLPSVFPLAAIWVLIVVMALPVITIGMMVGGFVPESQHADVWSFLLTRLPLITFAAVGLAIFTTNRAAGPLVAMKAVFDDVRSGNMDRRLRLRRDDKHFRGVETAFNEMMDAICEREAVLAKRAAQAPEDAAAPEQDDGPAEPA